MSKDTDIHWCDSSCNPCSGCEGCCLWIPKRGIKKCYAGRMTERFHGIGSFDQVQLYDGRVEMAAKWSDLTGTKRPEKPWLDGYPRLVFIGDMADIFSKAVPFTFLKREIIDVVREWNHVGIILTKRAQRMAEFSKWLMSEHDEEWPENLIAGTSVTTQATANARIPHLLQVGNARTIRFLSVEPILEEINLGDLTEIHWVIVGGCSGPEAAQTDINWISNVAEQCNGAVVPCFVKQLGAKPYLPPERDGGTGYFLPIKDPKGGDMSEWPDNLKVRQMPKMIWKRTLL